MSQNDIQEVEISIEQAKEMIERGRAAMRLKNNPDFRKLISEGYFRDEASRLVLLMSDPALPETSRAHIFRDLNGIGGIARYLDNILRVSQRAEEDLHAFQETLEEIRTEELAGTDE